MDSTSDAAVHSSAHPRPHRLRGMWLVAIVATLFLMLLLALASVVPFKSETLRQRVIATLAYRLDSDVELKELRMRVLPRFHAEGAGVTIRQKGRGDV